METNQAKPNNMLHPGYFNNVLRSWQTRLSKVNTDCLIYPIFVHYDKEAFEEIESMPGQYRIGVEKLEEFLKPMVENGLKTVLLFGVINESHKRQDGSEMFAIDNPIFSALQTLKRLFPELVIACDVCLCGYTDHGHCYVKNGDTIDMDKTLDTFRAISIKYAKFGADIIAPSDMMDGRIDAIHKELIKSGFRSRIAIMSYSAKFASCFYGPFRAAANSAPQDGDRKAYQLPPGSNMLARRAAERDIEEGADIVMVKPGMPFLDIVRDIKSKHQDHPVAVYQVSGEYAMLYHASKHGVFDLRTAVFESLESMHRAGADIIISYYTPKVLEWIKESQNKKVIIASTKGTDD